MIITGIVIIITINIIIRQINSTRNSTEKLNRNSFRTSRKLLPCD